jgi:hypothetical protein
MTTPDRLAWISDRAWRILVVLALVAVVVVAGISLAAVFVPALLAVVAVPVARPLFTRLSAHLPASAAAALVILLALLVLSSAFWLMLTAIAGNWSELRSGITEAVTVVTGWIDDWVGGLDNEQVATIAEDLQDLTRSVVDVLVGGVTKSVAALGSLLIGFAFSSSSSTSDSATGRDSATGSLDRLPPASNPRPKCSWSNTRPCFAAIGGAKRSSVCSTPSHSDWACGSSGSPLSSPLRS